MVQAAHLPPGKTLETLDAQRLPLRTQRQLPELCTGHLVERADNLLLFGLPGTGKTHIATGLALAACRQGYRVRFYNTADLVSDLLLAQDDQRLPKLLQGALKHQLVVLDELGFIPFTLPGAQLLFQFCSTLYERVAFIVTTNLRFADWSQIFGDERLTHHAHILEFRGESYRLRERLQHEPTPLHAPATAPTAL